MQTTLTKKMSVEQGRPQNGDGGEQQRQQRQRSHSASIRRKKLAEVAQETLDVLPGILKELPHIKADESVSCDPAFSAALDPAACPGFTPGATIRVVNQDTLNAALDVMKLQPAGSRVAVLNFASHKNPGGGWRRGATAQEEALCYRSSLALSLHQRYYPWPLRQALYTPDVIVIRSAMDKEHKLLVPAVAPADLPLLSVISVAALCRPERATVDVPDGSGLRKKDVFGRGRDRDLTKGKMRQSLRIAAANGHSALVLGALGCGAFRNPPEEVAECWVEVLREAEFSGGWWRHIWFAVYDHRNEGNFDIFDRLLGGLKF